MMFIVSILVLLLTLLSPLLCSYRHVALSSPEICPPPSQASLPPSPSRTLQLDQGTAVVLTLANIRLPFWKCDLDIKASPGHGLMVRVEDATLRRNTERVGKCVDYVQLGRDDNMPFFTWDKSGKLCGDLAPGYSYDVNNGQLLVWVRLGEWQGVDQVELSIIVTQYRKGDSKDLTHYRACNSGHHWVSEEYFCDGRVNCAADPSPADESHHVCREDGGGLGDDIFSNSPAFPSGPPLNLLSITLVLVSSAVLMFLFVLLLVRLKMTHNCCWSSSSLPPDCELPDRTARVVPVSTIPHSTATTMYLEPSATTSLVRGTTPDTEPPPAYQDLFPAGYKYTEKEEVGLSRDCSLLSDRGPGKDVQVVLPVVAHAGLDGDMSDVL